jgi:hypothetical protein
VREQDLPGLYRLDELDRYLGPVSGGVLAEGVVALREITRTGMPASEQVTQPSWSNVQLPAIIAASSRTATLSGRL